MAITTRDGIIAGLATNNTPNIIDKASIASQVAAGYSSLWRATGVPGQGAIPAAAAYCTNALLGSLQLTNQTAPATSYLGKLEAHAGNANTNLEIRDRIAHMGGLNATLTTAQTVGIDLNTINAGGAIPTARRGVANFSEIQWFLEWYTSTGATASNATVAVTYDDGSTGNLAVIAVGGSIAASRCLPLVPAVAGRYIRAVTSVTLSASTGTAGSFGVTATRLLATVSMPTANKSEVFDWATLGLVNVPNDSCLSLYMLATTTSTGVVRGRLTIIHG